MTFDISSAYHRLSQSRLVRAGQELVQTHPLKCVAGAIVVGSVAVSAVALVRAVREHHANNSGPRIIIVRRPGMTPAQEMAEYFARVEASRTSNPFVLSAPQAAAIAPRIVPPAIIEPVRSDRERFLDSLLQSSARANDMVACRRLVKEGASPNVKDDIGLTPLKEALVTGDLRKCKRLIDIGSFPDVGDLEKIKELLSAQGIGESRLPIFLTRRPNPGDLEIFINGDFRSLEQIAQRNPQDLQYLPRGMVVFNIGDESFHSNYCNVTEKFHRLWNAKYAKIANHFIVARALVEDSKQFLPLIDSLDRWLPGRSLEHLIIDGHSNHTYMVLSAPNCIFSTRDGGLMQKLASRIAPFGTITLSGCFTSNLAQKFSLEARGRIVCSAEYLVSDVVFKIFESQVLEKPQMVTFFECDDQSHLTIYANGKVIARRGLQNQSVPNEVVSAIESRVIVENVEMNEQPVRIFQNYFSA